MPEVLCRLRLGATATGGPVGRARRPEHAAHVLRQLGNRADAPPLPARWRSAAMIIRPIIRPYCVSGSREVRALFAGRAVVDTAGGAGGWSAGASAVDNADARAGREGEGETAAAVPGRLD